jgi:hypothetical protein
MSDSKNIPTGALTPAGRILPCPGSVPNCVSTSSTSDLYGPALASPDSPADAAAALDASIQSLHATLLADSDPATPPGSVFRAYRVPRPRGGALSSGGATDDTLEVLIKAGGGGGGGEGAAGGSTVLYRSVAGGAAYVFPFQTPILDSVQRDRVTALFRVGLGWRPVGCDLLECYE